MTNATEQTKRALYENLEVLKYAYRTNPKPVIFGYFESSLEAYLEELRKARVEFTEKSDREIQRRHREALDLEDKIRDLERRLAAMTEDRDDCQKRMQAIDHAYCEQSNLAGAQTKEIERLNELNRITGQELIRVQGIARQHLDDCRSAEKLSNSLDERLRDAQVVIGHQEQLITGQRLAIADLYLAKHRAPRPEKAPRAPCANTMTILGAVVDCQQIVSDWAVYGHKAKGAMKKLADVLNGTPALTEAMKSFEKADGCMHSFHPAFPGGEQCIFCGVKRDDVCAHSYASNGGCPECGEFVA